MAWLLLLVWAGLLLSSAHCEIRDTKYGQVEGMTHTLHNGKRVHSFVNVRYAKPPTGALRFAKPEEPEPWDGAANATALGSICPQGLVGVLLFTHPHWDHFSEDCLNLNIYTPADDDGPHPVMVWFHGGAFSGSGNIQYPGYFMAAKGALVIVANYRLGIYGFATTEDDVAPGNWGLWDQNLVLKWVQENAANFGGDSDQVTIYGQSAGAASVGMHVVSPESRGLFHRAMYQSGSEMAMWALNYPASQPSNYFKQVARHANVSCPDDDSQAMVDCLREVDWDTLWQIPINCTPGHFCLGFAPVVDGPGGFLPKLPGELREEGDFAKVPVLSGQTNKDGSPYTLSFIPAEDMDEGFNRTFFEETLKTRLINYFSPLWNDTAKTTEDVFQAMNFYYTNQPYDEDKEANRQAFNDIVTDVGFGVTADAMHKSNVENNVTVYNFVLAYRSKNATDLFPEWMGVPHIGDIPYVWAYPLLHLNEELRDHCEVFIDVIDWNEDDVTYTDYILDLWYNFAKHGNPTPTPVATPDGGEITWETFSNDGYNYLHMGWNQTLLQNYRQKNFAFWTQYLLYVSGIQLPLPLEQGDYPDYTVLSSDDTQGVVDRFWTERVMDTLWHY